MTENAATKGLRMLVGSSDENDALILAALLDQFCWSKSCEPGFEAVFWREIAQLVALRTPAPLICVIRFFAVSMCRNPARVPAEIDEALSIGLMLILNETEMASPAEHLGYDPFLARYFGAILVSAMDQVNRGDPAMRAAWAEAIESDPLPDTRRGRASALRQGTVGEDVNED